MARKIAVCSQKGGVGKTTTSINLAAALALEGHRVLLIDNDPQANTTTCCGFRQQDIHTSLYEILVKEERFPEEAIRKCSLDSMWLLPASASLVSAEIELVKEMGRELILKEKMETVQDQYDFIIVDCSPGVSLLVLNALFFCEEIIIPIQSQFLALEGLDRILHAVHVIQKRMQHPVQITGIVCTMYDRRTKLSSYILFELYRLFGDGLFSTVITINTKLAEAPLRGMSIFEHHPSGNASDNYRRLAQEIIARGEPNWKEGFLIAPELACLETGKNYYNLMNDDNQIFKQTIETLVPLISKCMTVDYPARSRSPIVESDIEKNKVKEPEDSLDKENKKETTNPLTEEDLLWM